MCLNQAYHSSLMGSNWCMLCFDLMKDMLSVVLLFALENIWRGYSYSSSHTHGTTLNNCVCLITIDSSGAKQECVVNHTWFILRNINSQSKLFASSDVEAQTVVIWCGEEMHDPAESAVWTRLWRCATALLHHHPPVNQIHPAHTHVRDDKYPCMKKFKYTIVSFSPALRPVSIG